MSFKYATCNVSLVVYLDALMTVEGNMLGVSPDHTLIHGIKKNQVTTRFQREWLMHA